MADTPTPPTLEDLDGAMFTGSSWMYSLMKDFERRSFASVVLRPQFQLLLAATTHMLNLMSQMSLAVIVDDLRIKQAEVRDVPSHVVQTGFKKVAKKRLKRVSINSVARPHDP